MRRREFLRCTRWRGGRVAVRCARAAARDAGGGLSASFIARTVPAHLSGFRQGLNDTGFVENQNVMVEYRWARGAYDRLPSASQRSRSAPRASAARRRW